MVLLKQPSWWPEERIHCATLFTISVTNFMLWNGLGYFCPRNSWVWWESKKKARTSRHACKWRSLYDTVPTHPFLQKHFVRRNTKQREGHCSKQDSSYLQGQTIAVNLTTPHVHDLSSIKYRLLRLHSTHSFSKCSVFHSSAIIADTIKPVSRLPQQFTGLCLCVVC